MAVMSFAHLKNKKQKQEILAEQIAPSPSRAVVAPEIIQQATRPAVQKGGILSFAHMKKSKQGAMPAIPETVIETKKESSRDAIFRIPAVMPTARLQATNYCQGCGRFLPSGNDEKGLGNAYGRCLRKGEIDSETETEVWKVIPAAATVARCWFNIKK